MVSFLDQMTVTCLRQLGLVLLPLVVSSLTVGSSWHSLGFRLVEFNRLAAEIDSANFALIVANHVDNDLVITLEGTLQ